ncbi:HAD family hydrolase [Roseospirillum parvum]|uniref:phosphoglycolate phosphatase n=1 Tax=Roseospirillum parvum TaxID=83401 RepID=A0A1G7Y9D3_9PROT|nr:HAD family hydrolase [Roseospirillum parvum]SDG93098.1 phosphoglycolate phosphatase [Roseospirillum parvum]
MNGANLPAPRAVLLDWDNTLIDSWPVIHAAWNETLAAMGHPVWDVADTRRNVGRSLRDTFPELFKERWEEARDVFYAAFGRLHIDRLSPFPGAGELLAGLAGAGVALGVVSNKTTFLLLREAEALGWNSHFHRLVGAGDAARDKPHPDGALLALEGSGIAPGPDVWFVGDAAVDMGCGRQAGCTTVLIADPERAADAAFAEWPADHRVDDWAGFRDLCRVSFGSRLKYP